MRFEDRYAGLNAASLPQACYHDEACMWQGCGTDNMGKHVVAAREQQPPSRCWLAFIISRAALVTGGHGRTCKDAGEMESIQDVFLL